MHIDSLEKLYVHELKDLYSAGNQLQDILPRVIDTVQDDELRSELEGHRSTVSTQIGRVKEIFTTLDFEPGGHRCRGMEGLITELKDALGTEVSDEIRDPAVVAGLQRIEHYLIAGYGVARTFADKLGRDHDADTLQLTLDEAGRTDRMMTTLAERRLNFEALVA